MQLSGNLKARTGLRARIALAIASSIVGADAREALHTRLDGHPTHCRLAKTGVQNDSRATGAGTVDVETIAADVHHPASDGKPASIGNPSDRLIRHSAGQG